MENGALPCGIPSWSAIRGQHGLQTRLRRLGRLAADIEPSETVPAWPYLLRAEFLVFMGTMLLCVVLGILFDAPLKVLADPVHPENPAKAPWYSLALQELVSYSAFVGSLFIPVVTVVGLGLVPYLDREKEPAGIYLDWRPQQAHRPAQRALRHILRRAGGGHPRELRMASGLVPGRPAALHHPVQPGDAPHRRIRGLVPARGRQDRLHQLLGHSPLHLLSHGLHHPHLCRHRTQGPQLGLLLVPFRLAGRRNPWV